MNNLSDALRRVGATVLERGWLSSNSVVFTAGDETAAVVDTGYAAHAAQTVKLVERALRGKSLGRVINTHLHSDHCGGNAALSARFGCGVLVPYAAHDAASAWDMTRLTFQATGQRCDRFAVAGSLRPGETVVLGRHAWEIHACGGHDADAVLLFEPRHRVLISGDALWEQRVSIVFEAFSGAHGFDAALESLNLIERLDPAVVVPGHGRPFTDAKGAIVQSRSRIEDFRRGRSDHLAAARSALLMFHMLEHQTRTVDQLEQWATAAKVFGGEYLWVSECTAKLVAKGRLRHACGAITLPPT